MFPSKKPVKVGPKLSVTDRVQQAVKDWESLNALPTDSAMVKFNKEQKKKKMSQGPSRAQKRAMARYKAKQAGRIKI